MLLPCEVAVWVLQGGGRDTAVLVGYEDAEPRGGEQAMAVPWGRVGRGDGTVIDTARRLLFERAGAMTGPDEVFRVAHFDYTPGRAPDGGAAARVVLALHAGALTEVLGGQVADGIRLDRPALLSAHPHGAPAPPWRPPRRQEPSPACSRLSLIHISEPTRPY